MSDHPGIINIIKYNQNFFNSQNLPAFLNLDRQPAVNIQNMSTIDNNNNIPICPVKKMFILEPKPVVLNTKY